MKLLPFVFLFLLSFLFSCRKQQQPSTPGPEQTVTGYLRYWSISLDGAGLYYQKDIPADSKDSTDPSSWSLLLADGNGGYIVDKEGVDSLYRKYIDKHTQLRYRETGKKDCSGSNIPNYCLRVPVIDTLAFSLIP